MKKVQGFPPVDFLEPHQKLREAKIRMYLVLECNKGTKLKFEQNLCRSPKRCVVIFFFSDRAEEYSAESLKSAQYGVVKNPVVISLVWIRLVSSMQGKWDDISDSVSGV